MAELDAAAAAAAERLTRELDDDDYTSGGADCRPATTSSAAAAAAKDAPATTRPINPASRYAALLRWAEAALRRLRSWLARVVEWAADEFDPWIKWVVLDALFALATASVARRVALVRPLFEAVGWV